MAKKKPTQTEPERERKPTGGSQTLKARGLEQFIVTASPEEKNEMMAAAALDGKKLSHWAREHLTRLAKERLNKK